VFSVFAHILNELQLQQFYVELLYIHYYFSIKIMFFS